MNQAHVQELPAQETAKGSNKDTGFPEPLSEDRNTTLPHPEADTTPGATIEAPDIALSRTRSRHSIHLPGRGHSRKSSKIGNGTMATMSTMASPNGSVMDVNGSLYGNIEYADGTKERSSVDGIGGREEPGDGEENLGQDGVNGEKRDEQGYKEGERKKGVLRKLQLHKV